tara:strand:+ start:137 stop:313 length:177 start_codon:yes stop_codon:yes gene_type:complete
VIILEFLPPGSEILLLLISVSGVATWWSKNIIKSKSHTMFFAFLGAASAISLLYWVYL